MAFLKRLLNICLLLLLSNIVIITHIYRVKPVLTIIFITALSIFFIVYNINPVKNKGTPMKLKIMIGGSELLTSSIVLFITEILIYLFVYIFSKISISLITSISNTVVCIVIILILMWNGIIRILCTSKQLGLILKIMIFIVWWIPLVNIIVLSKYCSIVRREYRFETAKIELNNIRKESEVCKTKYPILLVHGIFWRDWQLFNYWGRIPKELIKNGATIYYGNQQSATQMEICAQELKNQILNIIDKEKCEKVNIIAHSKGGLDARYAISCLGMDEYVGSLTTIGTPHQGCILVDRLLKKIPNKIILAVAKKYNSAYKKLGDTEPDFLSGINDLTAKKCVEFNCKVGNKETVIYQSTASKMQSMFSAGFPLNLGYAIIHRNEGENDGFVSTESSKWGDFLGCYSTKRKRGVSHGDMIDLMRENIHGFDVREFYVEIVKGLKLKNL